MAKVVEIIERYKSTLGKDTINENPQTIVVYENIETKELGIINLVKFCSNHQYFGFEYKVKKGIEKFTLVHWIPWRYCISRFT